MTAQGQTRSSRPRSLRVSFSPRSRTHFVCSTGRIRAKKGDVHATSGIGIFSTRAALCRGPMKTPRRTFLHRIGGTAALLFISTVASRAQSFPSHPIKIVVPYPAGGPADTVARVATQGLGAELGVSVFIENVSGAGGRLGT